MNTFVQLIQSFTSLFVWWVIVQPWEQVLRTRCGGRPVLLSGGMHFRIPYADALFRQSIRRRVTGLQLQTLMTLDGKTLTLAAVLSYAIGDIQKLYETLHHAEDTVANLAASALARYVASHAVGDCTPARIEGTITKELDLARYGLTEVEVSLVDFAFVRTYRLINEPNYRGSNDRLNTVYNETAPPAGPR